MSDMITIQVPADPHPPAKYHPARRIACPRCGVSPGEACHAATEWPHPARVKALSRLLIRQAWEADATHGRIEITS